jgi:4-carboxymuconolactone decarboxylase
MRLTEPRIEPVKRSEWTDEVKELLAPMEKAGGRVLNIFATLARYPKLAKRWLVFGNHVLFKSSLPARERELVILRIGYLCKCDYEWGQHVVIGKESGLSDADIKRIPDGPDAKGWKPFDSLLLRATDELFTDAFIGDATWGGLGERYNQRQLMDLVFTIGQYTMVSMALNSFGVQLDAGITGLPED